MNFVDGEAVKDTGEGIGVGGGVGLGHVDGGLGQVEAVEDVAGAAVMTAVGATDVFEPAVDASGVVGAVTMDVVSMFKRARSRESPASEMMDQDG